MSLIKTALITAMLGTSTAAVAAPGVSFSANADFSFATTSAAPVVRDHRSSELPYSMPTTRSTTWSILSAPLQLDSGMDVIRLQGRQTLSQIRLQATSGNVQIDRVTVKFLDGTLQTVRLRNAISAQNPMLQFDVQANASGVQSISILGSGNRRASYQVFAQSLRVEQPMPPRQVNFTGVYASQYGSVFLEQTGNRLHGEYPEFHGTMDGYVTNGIAVVTWKQPDGTGRATFTIGAGGKIEGTLGTGTSATNYGEWDLIRSR